ncbi:MAG: hypothetical protein V1858_02135 [Candidatus Gottesmanbacteria bacterium]
MSCFEPDCIFVLFLPGNAIGFPILVPKEKKASGKSSGSSPASLT